MPINPYHFVPLGEGDPPDSLDVADFKERDTKEVTHDRFTKGTFTGRIVCRLETCDPLVIGGTQVRHEDPPGPTEIRPYLSNGEPAIPGTTLRGLISAVAEASSNSSLRVLADTKYSIRMGMRDALHEIGMIVVQNGQHRIRPLNLLPGKLDGYRRLGESAVPYGFLATPRRSWSADHPEFWYARLEGTKIADGDPIPKAEWDKLPEQKKTQYTRGILRILGLGKDGERASQIPSGKTHELFIPYPIEMENNPSIPIPDDVWESFQRVADLRTDADGNLPYELSGANRNDGSRGQLLRLREGDLVYFERDSHGNRVAWLALSAIWRWDCKSAHFYFHKVSPELLPFNPKRKKISLAEKIFGFVEQREEEEQSSKRPGVRAEERAALSLASRVRFSTAKLAPQQTVTEPYVASDPVVLRILSSPKPPCPVMYFRAVDEWQGYISNRNFAQRDHAIAMRPQGRKFYVHRHNAGNNPQNPPWKTNDPTADVIQKVQVQPIKKGVCFDFHIDFENLSPSELQLLVYAISPNEGFRHKLGLGKPIGLGTIQLHLLGIFYVDPSQRYCAKAWDNISERYAARDVPRTGLPWHADYAREFDSRASLVAESSAFLSLEQLRKGWDERLTNEYPEIRRALQVLGSPVHREVKYPAVVGGEELEGFKWFAANAQAANPSFLHPIAQRQLPSLPEHNAPRPEHCSPFST